MIKALFLLFLCVGISGFSQSKSTTPNFLPELKSRKDFDLLKGQPLSNNFNGIECVKLVYRISDKKLFYLESKKFKWHYRFTSEVLYDPDDLETFNEINYGQNPQRKYVLATFNYNTNTHNYFLQFASSDDPSDEMIDKLVTKISETFYKKGEFKILLNTTILLRRKKEISEKHKILTSDELFKNQNYQAICKGQATGVLKHIKAEDIKDGIDYTNNILILNGSSNELPICKGLVTNEFQTPLSHICLLTNNRKTAAAAQKNILTVDSLLLYENKLVKLIVKENKLSITLVSDSAQKIGNSKAKKLRELKSDTSFSKLQDLSKFSYKNKKQIGSKAANLAELRKLSKIKGGFEVPKNAFAIPFHYYSEHIKNNRIDSLIQELLNDTSILKKDSILDEKLANIREAIITAPLNKFFIDTLSSLCLKKFGNKKVRFRSSSNCEDEASFNGAGLYTSKTGIANHPKKSYESAVKEVWASLWYTRAYKERSYFNFDHKTVYMGILVHQTFDDEIVNGVAITKNLYRDYEAGFVINMQEGEEEVVSPNSGVQCEQLVSYMNTTSDFYNANRSADWISFSSLHPQSSLLSNDELLSLTQCLEMIKRHFYDLYKVWPNTEYKDFAMDVEFKIIIGSNNKKSILIKQARPFND